MHTTTTDALNNSSVMHCTLSAESDPSFNWPAQAHLKATKQPKSCPLLLFKETLMAPL